MDRVKRSRMSNFYARLNRGQLENSLFYCVNVCVLRRSERALKRNNFEKEQTKVRLFQARVFVLELV